MALGIVSMMSNTVENTSNIRRSFLPRSLRRATISREAVKAARRANGAKLVTNRISERITSREVRKSLLFRRVKTCIRPRSECNGRSPGILMFMALPLPCTSNRSEKRHNPKNS